MSRWAVSSSSATNRSPWFRSVLRYFWTDDCGECTGTFLGGRATALLGYRVVFLGASVRMGHAAGGPTRSEFGLIWNLHVRLALGFGR